MYNEVDYFYHATGDRDDNLKVMLNILRSGGIKSLRLQGKTNYNTNFNGDDYVSLGAWNNEIEMNSPDYFFKSCFFGFITNLPCFIISPNINAIKCDEYHGTYDPDNERVSQYIDEWHTKDEITLDKIVGIAIPEYAYKDSKNLKVIKEILTFAELYNWEVFKSDENLVTEVRKRFYDKEKNVSRKI